MADRYRTPDGWTVEVVQLDAGDRLWIRHHAFYVADVVNVDDLARWIPAAELSQLERQPDTLTSGGLQDWAEPSLRTDVPTIADSRCERPLLVGRADS